MFRCRHLTADAISWTVNGLSRRDFPEDIVPGSTNDHDGTLVYTLTIPARSEYNGTEVECVAFFRDGSQSTPPVTLTLIEGIHYSREWLINESFNYPGESTLTTTAGIVLTTVTMDQQTTLTGAKRR